MKFYQQWIGSVTEADGTEFEFPAAVPGNIQNDYARAGNWGDLNNGNNSARYKTLEDRTWRYRARLRFDQKPGERVYFVSGGIDYFSSVSLNGTELLRHEGMFTDVVCDLTDRLTGDDELTVTVYPHPKRKDAYKGTRDEADTSVKPPVCYGWDWHPRILYSGMWEDAYIETRGRGYIRDVRVRYTLSADLQTADVRVEADCDEPVTVELRDPDGNLVYSGGETAFTVRDVRLWWCNGHGEPNLYGYRVTSPDCVREGKIGFRTVRLVMAEGEWKKPEHFPKSRSNPPICLELNGKRIFGKGSNMPAPEIFPGTITKERYAQVVRLVKDANMNLLRMWGGCGIQKQAFYDCCDENGILIWQEFPLACNAYGASDGAHYCRVLKTEAESIVRRLRNHACLTLWCGGNELFNNWSLMTDQSYPLRLLNKVTLELSPEIPFLPTSPVAGMAHGPYAFADPAYGNIVELFQKTSATAYTEFGCWALSPREYLRTFCRDEDFEQRSTDPDSAWVQHHMEGKVYYLGVDRLTSTLNRFGFPVGNYDENCRILEWMQTEGFRFVFEEARRQSPTCSMAVNWFFTEPWKVMAGNSLVLYPDVTRPAYFSVKDALRPVCASARYRKFDWHAGDTFSAEIWLLNDTGSPVEDEITAVLEIDGKARELAVWRTGVSNRNLRGPTVHFPLPACGAEYLTLKLISKRGASAEYHLRFYPDQARKASGPRAMNETND